MRESHVPDAFDVGDKPAYVGQQMDVFIETAAQTTNNQ
jgi:hypothetical protein